jgi:uncharacterized radical SAM superfamily Fe-S cluster-containing enzyme
MDLVRSQRPHLYYDIAISICATCYRRVDAKVVIEDGKVFFLKRCPEHGHQRVLIADDEVYWRRARESFIKPSEMPKQFGTPVKYGCPYDCGLCADHEQHACVAVVEVGDHCNLKCPICYAGSGPDRPLMRPLAQIERMLDAVVASEGEPDVVQISGGEPTIHPQFFEILDAARARPIRHLMVNSNGLRIARDAEFAKRLATYRSGFEIYLQFDGFEQETLKTLRGADLRAIRQQAIDRLNEHDISTTLVVTLQKGLNDHEIGPIIDWALKQPCIRGVTFQPVQHAGRADGFNPATDRLTLTEVRRMILEQTSIFSPEDLLPVPCHPDCVMMGYAFKLNGTVTPLTGLLDPAALLEGPRSTIVYERDETVRAHVMKMFSTGTGPEGSAAKLKELLCCLPQIMAPPGLGYHNLFRIIIMQFMDAHSFDVRSVKRACVQIVQPDDGRLIPFDTYNLFYRDDLEKTRLAPLRARAW